MVKIAVIGAGIIGLSSAYCIQQKFPTIDITIITEHVSPNTTGDGAAGVWGPYLLGETPPELIEKWSRKTHELFLELWKSPEGGEMGITLLPFYRVTSETTFPDPEWKDAVFGFRKISPLELKRLNKPNLSQGSAFITFICECSKLLPILQRRFEAAGGKIIRRRVNKLQELIDSEEFDIAINCTGLQARELVNDKFVYPVRGQILRVEAPGMFYGCFDESDDGGYIIPNQTKVILGGTHQENDWNLKPSDVDRKFIQDTCYEMVPSLKNARILEDFVGLRPARKAVRLEMETVFSTNRKSTGKPFIVIHNYGHSGSGVTLFWGCALDTCELVEKAINKLRLGTSKL